MLDRLFAITWPLNYRKVILMRFLSIVAILTLITERGSLQSIDYRIHYQFNALCPMLVMTSRAYM